MRLKIQRFPYTNSVTMLTVTPSDCTIQLAPADTSDGALAVVDETGVLRFSVNSPSNATAYLTRKVGINEVKRAFTDKAENVSLPDGIETADFSIDFAGKCTRFQLNTKPAKPSRAAEPIELSSQPNRHSTLTPDLDGAPNPMASTELVGFLTATTCAVNAMGEHVTILSNQLAQLANNLALVEDRLVRGQQFISRQVTALQGDVLRLSTPPPPTGRDAEQHIEALRRLFAVFGAHRNDGSQTSTLPRDLIGARLKALLDMLARAGSPVPVGVSDAAPPPPALLEEIADLADKLGGADPSQRFESAAGRRDLTAAIAALTELAKDNQRAEPLSDEHIEAQLVGFAKSIWAWDEDALTHDEHAARRPLHDALELAGISWFLPFDDAYDASRHRIGGREPARPGEPVNRVISVIAPGFTRLDGQTTKIHEKATVVLSDY